MFRVSLYFKSGNVIEITCESYKFEFKKTSNEFCGYKIDGMKPFVSFQPSQLEAYLVNK